jgi:hypothetical protein
VRQCERAGVLPDPAVAREVDYSPGLGTEQPSVACDAVGADVIAEDGNVLGWKGTTRMALRGRFFRPRRSWASPMPGNWWENSI